MSQVEPLQVPDPEWISRYHEALKRWYAQHKRDLPWRRTDDPYAVWISEMMLQQTQVAQARPYFERFMARFPTVHSLAVAPMADILKLWEGLGYYARARNMGRAAKQIVAEFDGRTPDELTDLLKLPGIGPYTAAAVLSIAYGKNHAVVDGNVVRVLCRLMNLQNRPDTAQTRSLLSSLADQLLEQGAAADYEKWVERARVDHAVGEHRLRHKGYRLIPGCHQRSGPRDVHTPTDAVVAHHHRDD